VDVSESPKEISIHCEVPGVKKENIKVKLENDVLSVSGERASEQEHQDKEWKRIERSYGKFERSFKLPENSERDLGKIKAAFKDGVLTVTVPKVEAQPGKEIQIE
jgi:HSP20 family protein